MATAGSLLSEETFTCSVCLDVFTQPVSTPCGHNFCRRCLYMYWDMNNICQCPVCKRVFPQKPELQVNTIVSELVEKFRALAPPQGPDPDPPEEGAVLCDICSKEKAVKSCLTCLASFCQVHLEPHQRVAGLRGHALLDPLKNLEERLCKTHGKLKELYCRTDQEGVCTSCSLTDHKGHDMVPMEEEYESVILKMGAALADLQNKKRMQYWKLARLKMSVTEAEQQKLNIVENLNQIQVMLVQVIENKFREVKDKSEGFCELLEREMEELEKKKARLELLSKSDDHQDVVQSFPALNLPFDTYLSSVSVSARLSFEDERGNLGKMKMEFDQLIKKMLGDNIIVIPIPTNNCNPFAAAGVRLKSEAIRK